MCITWWALKICYNLHSGYKNVVRDLSLGVGLIRLLKNQRLILCLVL
jgi:hypothetical protein